MVMCSQCHKRVAVIFVTKMENGEKSTQGLCMKCAKELGVPIDNIVGNVMNQRGVTPDQLENMETELGAFLQGETPSDADDNEDGGAPAIDFPNLFRQAGVKVYLQELLGCDVDVVRMREQMNSVFKQQILKYGVRVY